MDAMQEELMKTMESFYHYFISQSILLFLSQKVVY